MRRTNRTRGGIIAFAMFALCLMPVIANAQSTDRAKALAQKLMCICGCNQILGSCNHVGCKYSHDMLAELDQHIARGESDDLVLQDFVQEYGSKVLAEPPSSGFNWAAWIVPVVAPLIAAFFVWEVARRWRGRATMSAAGGPQVPDDMLARVQHDSSKDFDV